MRMITIIIHERLNNSNHIHKRHILTYTSLGAFPPPLPTQSGFDIASQHDVFVDFVGGWPSPCYNIKGTNLRTIHLFTLILISRGLVLKDKHFLICIGSQIVVTCIAWAPPSQFDGRLNGFGHTLKAARTWESKHPLGYWAANRQSAVVPLVLNVFGEGTGRQSA